MRTHFFASLALTALFAIMIGTVQAQSPSAFEDALSKVVTREEKNQVQPAKGNTSSLSAVQSSSPAQKTTSTSGSSKAAGEDLPKDTIVTPNFHCRYTRSHTLIWRDKGTGGAFDIGVWRPNLDPGWVRLGDIAVPSMSENCPDSPALIISWDDNHPAGDDKGPYLAKPIDYQWIWDDKKSGAKWDGSFWYPVPPKGYVSLGMVAQRSHVKPGDLGIMRCVRSDLVLPGKWIGHVWTDKKSGAKNDCAVWTQTVADGSAKEAFLVTNTVHGAGNYDNPPSASPYVLKGLSGDDAYKDALNGYLKVTRNGILDRMQYAVENARDVDQRALASEAHELKQLLAQAEPTSSDLKKLDNSQETLEGGASSTHSLPNISFSASSFSKAATDLKALGNTLQLKQIPGFDQLPLIKGGELKNVVFSQGEIAAGDEKGQPWICVSGDTVVSMKRLGTAAGKIVILSRLYKNLGLRTGFVLLGQTEDYLRKIPGMNQMPISNLAFSQIAVTYATEEHSWSFSELPDPVKDLFTVYSGGTSMTFNFDKGENFWLVAEIKDNGILAAPFTILDAAPPRVLFTVVFPQAKEESTKIRARLLNTYSPNFLRTVPFLKLSLPTLEISVGDFNGVSLLTDLMIALSNKLKLTLPLKIDFPMGWNPRMKGVSVSGLIPGMWKNPFGIKGFSIGNLAISGTFGAMPNLGLSGILDLGKGYKFDLAGALSFTSPIALSALRCTLSRDLGLGDLIEIQGILLKTAFPEMTIPSISAVTLPIDELKVRNPEFCLSEVDAPALGIQKGLTVKGTLVFGTVDLGSVDFWMLADKGVRCKAWVKGFKIGSLGISGAGPDKKDFTKDDNPIIDLEYWPVTEPPYTLKQHCYFSGRADMLGAHLNLFLDVAKDKLKVNMTGDFGNLLQVQVKGQGEHSLLKDITQGGSLSCSGEVQTAFIETLEKEILKSVSGNAAVSAAIKLVGDCVLRIRNIKISGTLDEFAKGSLPTCSVTFAVFGQGFTLSLPNVANTGLTGQLTKKIGDTIISLASDLIKDPLAFIGKVFDGFASLGEDVGKELIKVFGKPPAETWKDAQKQAVQQADKARQAAESGIKAASETAANLANSAASTAKKVADTMVDIATGAWDTVRGWF